MEDIINQATLVAGLATMGILQILKLKAFPSIVNRYPVPSLIVISTGAAIATALWDKTLPTTISDWIVLVAVIAVSAALTYRTTLQNWNELRSMEG